MNYDEYINKMVRLREEYRINQNLVGKHIDNTMLSILVSQCRLANERINYKMDKLTEEFDKSRDNGINQIID